MLVTNHATPAMMLPPTHQTSWNQRDNGSQEAGHQIDEHAQMRKHGVLAFLALRERRLTGAGHGGDRFVAHENSFVLELRQ
jgi:hypothetical protein